MTKYTVGSMFAGIGGICLGFKNAGCEMVWANEIDPFACSTYRLNHGNTYLVEGDIHGIDAQSIPDMTILTAGFPCQAFSIAGNRKGFDDERGVLFFEVLRVIKAKRPRVVFLENVKNLETHDGGRTFNTIKKYLIEEGYHIAYKVLNTCEYGNIPQNRERIYVVAFRDENDYNRFSFPLKTPLLNSIFFTIDVDDRKADNYYYTPESQYYVMLDEALRNGDTLHQLRRVYVRENKSNMCPTLTANMGTGGHNVPIIRDHFGIRKLTPEECIGFQGFPKDFQFPEMANCHKYKQAGNSVSVPVIERIAKAIVKALDG